MFLADLVNEVPDNKAVLLIDLPDCLQWPNTGQDAEGMDRR